MSRPGSLTSAGAAPPQPVRVLATAQAVDEGAQLLHVTDVLRGDHLLLDDVGLRQVCPFLKRHSFHPDKAQTLL